MNARCSPTYVFAGFLEAGKSTWIQAFLESEEINRYERVLLLVCESGETEYRPERFRSEHVQLCEIEAPEDLNAEMLLELAEQYRPNRTIIEYNGMWDLGQLLSALPACYQLAEITTVIDGERFAPYFMNLRPSFADKLRHSHRLIVNRPEGAFDRNRFLEITAAAAPKADVFYCDEEEQLTRERRTLNAYRLSASGSDTLIVPNDAYAAVYRELLHGEERYDGRAIQVQGRLIRSAAGERMIGRYVMICCMDDLAFSGLACELPEGAAVPDDSWVTATGRIRFAFSKSYAGRGPILLAEALRLTDAPADEIIYIQ
ncbi:MAG: hypothetical protein IJH38_07715 [Clostridia bacterium]|nr:hypothetical protein [Clostridia bacterium]